MLSNIIFILATIFIIVDTFCLVRWIQTMYDKKYMMEVNIYAYTMMLICMIYWLLRSFIYG